MSQKSRKIVQAGLISALLIGTPVAAAVLPTFATSAFAKEESSGSTSDSTNEDDYTLTGKSDIDFTGDSAQFTMTVDKPADASSDLYVSAEGYTDMRWNVNEDGTVNVEIPGVKDGQTVEFVLYEIYEDDTYDVATKSVTFHEVKETVNPDDNKGEETVNPDDNKGEETVNPDDNKGEESVTEDTVLPVEEKDTGEAVEESDKTELPETSDIPVQVAGLLGTGGLVSFIGSQIMSRKKH